MAPGELNDAGEIVGYYRDTARAIHGFVRDASGHILTVDLPGADTTNVFGISDGGRRLARARLGRAVAVGSR